MFQEKLPPPFSTFKNEAAGSSEMLVNTHHNKWCHNPPKMLHYQLASKKEKGTNYT
jgi:hypothetical protein